MDRIDLAEPGRTYPQNSSVGILYAEDFGLPRSRPQARPAAAPPPLTPPILGQPDIDRACIRAVQAAEQAWAESAADRRAEALSTLSLGLAQARQDGMRHAETVADGLVRTILTIVAGILPDLSRTHGDAEVRALLNHLVPILAPSQRLVVRVHPDLVALLAEDIATLDETLLPLIELRPANLQPGDVRLAWEDGALERDAASLTLAIRECLDGLGLIVPATIPTPTGSAPHAE